MSGTMSADETEDRVLARIPTLTAVELEEVCGIISLDVPATQKGKRRELRKLLSNELMKDTEDDNLATLLLIHDHLYPAPTKEEEDDKAVAKVEPVVEKDKEEAADLQKDKGLKEGGSRLSESSDRFVETRMRELKLSGTIGGPTSAKNMTYTSLLFEVNNARKSRCPDSVIITGIIKAIHPDNDAREYLESSPDSSLDEVLEFVKNHCKQIDENGALYTAFQTARQLGNQKAIGFVTGLMVLRKKILHVSAEKGTPQDENMLRKQFFHLMFTGLRSESIRTELREKVRGDWTISDNQLLKMVREVSANEVERNQKFGDELEDEHQSDQKAVVNVVSCKQDKKKKENPFERIEGLLVNQDKEIKELRTQVMELKSKPQVPVPSASFPSYGAPPFHPQQPPQQQQQMPQQNHPDQKTPQFQQQPLQQQQFHQLPPQQQQLQQQQLGHLQAFYSLRPKRRGECNNCWQMNADRCPHCFKCDGTDHKARECQAPKKKNE